MNNYNPEYDDEAGMADNNLETLRRAVDGIDDVINAGDNLPEWCQEKIAIAKSMLVAVWDYMRSEEERGAVSETKKSHKRPKYSIKPKSSTLPAYQPGGDKKKKKKRFGYFEQLESKLSDSLQEQQDRMAGVGMGNYVVDKSPTEDIRPKSSVKCFRQGDEWVVQIKGTIVRIPTDEADSSEEAVAQAKSNLGISKAKKNFKMKESGETVSLIYVNGKPATKYAHPGDARKDLDRLKAKFPDKNIELKTEFSENKAWTHDSLAAKLFEQDITYESQLNRRLQRKLGK